MGARVLAHVQQDICAVYGIKRGLVAASSLRTVIACCSAASSVPSLAEELSVEALMLHLCSSDHRPLCIGRLLVGAGVSNSSSLAMGSQPPSSQPPPKEAHSAPAEALWDRARSINKTMLWINENPKFSECILYPHNSQDRNLRLPAPIFRQPAFFRFLHRFHVHPSSYLFISLSALRPWQFCPPSQTCHRCKVQGSSSHPVPLSPLDAIHLDHLCGDARFYNAFSTFLSRLLHLAQPVPMTSIFTILTTTFFHATALRPLPPGSTSKPQGRCAPS